MPYVTTKDVTLALANGGKRVYGEAETVDLEAMSEEVRAAPAAHHLVQVSEDEAEAKLAQVRDAIAERQKNGMAPLVGAWRNIDKLMAARREAGGI